MKKFFFNILNRMLSAIVSSLMVGPVAWFIWNDGLHETFFQNKCSITQAMTFVLYINILTYQPPSKP